MNVFAKNKQNYIFEMQLSTLHDPYTFLHITNFSFPKTRANERKHRIHYSALTGGHMMHVSCIIHDTLLQIQI